jgi:hypothetical protein
MPDRPRDAIGERGCYGSTKEAIFLVEEASEGGYTACSVGDSIFTEGDNLEVVGAGSPRHPVTGD